jgi:Sec-independent protein translocase protein TatA
LGIFEILIILIVALVVLGPEQMPELIRAGIKIYREIRTAASDVIEEITQTIEAPPPPPSDANSPPHPPETALMRGPLDQLEAPSSPEQDQPAAPVEATPAPHSERS